MAIELAGRSSQPSGLPFSGLSRLTLVLSSAAIVACLLELVVLALKGKPSLARGLAATDPFADLPNLEPAAAAGILLLALTLAVIVWVSARELPKGRNWARILLAVVFLGLGLAFPVGALLTAKRVATSFEHTFRSVAPADTAWQRQTDEALEGFGVLRVEALLIGIAGSGLFLWGASRLLSRRARQAFGNQAPEV